MAEQIILAVPTNKLFETHYFEGFKDSSEHDYVSVINKHMEWHPRTLMEKDHSYKQPIAYVFIVNPSLKKIFSYQRAKKDEHYTEKRLQGKWSWGIGGHIELDDETSRKKANAIEYSMIREVKEETDLEITSTPKVLGYINDDSDDVGKVHFAVLYVVETEKTQLTPNDSEVTNFKFRTISELKEIINNPENKVEGWSKIAFAKLREILQ